MHRSVHRPQEASCRIIVAECATGRGAFVTRISRGTTYLPKALSVADFSMMGVPADASQNFLLHQVDFNFFFHAGRSIFATPSRNARSVIAYRRPSHRFHPFTTSTH
jgi:hypothetical protein